MFPPKIATWFDLNDLETEGRIARSPELFELALLSVQSSDKILDYSHIAHNIGSGPVTVKNYFSVLEF